MPFRLTLDGSERMPREVPAGRFVQSASLSADGDRVLLGARGEVLSLDPATGEARNLSGSSDAAERYPALSPDGRWIACFSDESREYELQLRDARTGETSKSLAVEERPSFYRELT